MDFLDSLDQTHNKNDKKTDRMRSWYLYEQFKTLEQHELDAAEVLKNRCAQERLLHQELTERRARRGLYDQVSVYISNPKIKRSQATCLSSTTDDFSESFCELHDFEVDKDSLDNSNHGSYTLMDYKALEEFEDTSCADSVSVVLDMGTTDRPAQRTIAENIKLHMQTVKDNMVSLERYTKMADEDHTSEDSLNSLGWPKPPIVHRNQVDENQLFYMWSKLVAFAYHIIQLNHGNCYYDYSSQLLTAVLACDVLRRGVNRMCDILQYYVSPVKYVSDTEERSTICDKKRKKKKSYDSKKIRKSSKYKINSSLHKKIVKSFECDHHNAEYSGCCWRLHRKCWFVEKMEQDKKRRQLRRRRRLKRSPWSEDLDCCSSDCGYNKRFANPMLKVVRYLDDVIQTDIQDFAY